MDYTIRKAHKFSGELDWVLTAVLDTLAWQIEPDYDRFKELFRNCKPVGFLFRGHILADRVMRAYNVVPVTHPRLPSLAGQFFSWGILSGHAEFDSYFFGARVEVQYS